MQHYTIIGAGGTGTHLLPALHTYLTALHGEDEWRLHIIDGDIVEAKNLTRQLFAPGTITMNKAEAAALSLNDTHHVVSHSSYLSEENIGNFIKSDDIVFICADNFTVRARIEEYAQTLDDIVIINGGNEEHDGSVQMWVRKDGEDVTPRISYLHPEIRIGEGEDRAQMTCQQAAALPGGQQTIIANMQAATWMLTALWRYHGSLHVLSHNQAPGPLTWTELQFDALLANVEHIDQRMSSHWRTA